MVSDLYTEAKKFVNAVVLFPKSRGVSLTSSKAHGTPNLVPQKIMQLSSVNAMV